MNTRVLFKNRWLALCEIEYRDRQGQLRTWESVTRVAGHGAASIIARVEEYGKEWLLVVKQFRPPVGGYVLELPAGLLDAGETPETAARRELAEETGYVAGSASAGPFVYNSPGLTSEKTALVLVEASGPGPAAPDGGEEIEVLLLPLRGLKTRLLQEAEAGVHLDAKLWCFALGLEMSGA